MTHHASGAGFRFLSDLSPAGCLHAVVARSAVPHARILSVDTQAAKAVAGVVAVMTAKDLPGKRHFGMRVEDQPVLCGDYFRAVGDPVAVVAATDAAAARRAASLISVAMEPLPVVASAEEALREGAPALHASGNLLHSTHYARGDLEAAFAQCVHIIEDEYTTLHQAPAFIETESALAVPQDGGMTVHAPGHWAEMERQEIAAILALPPDKVRVVGSPAGGSFGGKDQLHAQPLAALLAQATGRPVRLRWSREESFAYGVKRHPFRIRMRTGCDAEGRLLAHEVDLLADSGAYAQHGPEVLDTAHENVQGPYAFSAVSARGRLAYTNNGISGAMRGFGALQVHSALEQQIERLARLAGVDPRDFRARNLRADDALGQLGQTLAAPAYARQALFGLPAVPAARSDRRYLRGSGIALVEKGEGFARGGPNHAAMRIGIADGGRVLVRLGLSELGQGMAEAAALSAEQLLGCAREDVDVLLADTATTPDSGPIAASRGSGMCWRTVKAARPAFNAAVLDAAAALCGEPADRLRIGPGGVWTLGANEATVPFRALAGAGIDILVSAPSIETATGSGAVHAIFAACAAMATVSVDRLTGQIAVRHLHFVPVTGPVLSHAGVQAQMEGGAALGLGFTLLERLETASGRFTASNFDGYLIPTIADMGRVTVAAVTDIPEDALGPRGVGEISVNAAAPAIISAIHAATGFVARQLPIDPAQLLDHLEANA